MIRLVFAKLLHYTSLRKFAMLHAGGILLLIYVATRLTGMQIQGSSLPLGTLFQRPQAWATAFGLTRLLTIIPAFLGIQLITAEFELKLVRSAVIAGQERSAVALGWLTQNVFFAVFAVVITALGVLLFTTQSEGGAFGVTQVDAVACFVLYSLIYLTIAQLCAVVLRRPVAAIILLVATQLVVEPLLSQVLEHEGLSFVRPYLPFSAMSALVPWPGMGDVATLAAPMTAVAVGYGVLAWFASWLFLQQLDL